MQDSEENIRRFASENSMPWPVGIDKANKIASLYGVTFGSGVVFMDKGHVIVKRFLTGVKEKEFNEALEKSLK